MNNEKKVNNYANERTSIVSESTSELITIGITNYNSDNYLDECIASLICQSNKSIEIIIVDDNSTDNSIVKIKNIEKQHENVKAIFHHENSGSPDLGRQEIIAAAGGSYIIFADSDDYFADNSAIEKMLDEFRNDTELDYVYCNMLVVDKYSNPKGLWAYRQYSDNELIHDTFQRGGSGVIPMKGMFKRDFFIKNHLTWHSNETAGDTLSAIIYTKHGWKYKHLNLNLLCYRQYGESFTFNLKKRIKAIIKILDYIIDNFSEEIYFPMVPWKQFNRDARLNFKMYLLGQFYYTVLQVYHSQWPSWSGSENNKGENMQESLMPLRERVMYYLENCSTASYLLDSNIKNILSDVERLFEP